MLLITCFDISKKKITENLKNPDDANEWKISLEKFDFKYQNILQILSKYFL